MASEDVPPQRTEAVVRGDENCFCRDEMSDEKYEEIRKLSSALIEKNPKVFLPLLFRGRVQGCSPPPPSVDLRLSYTTGILQKKCGLLVLVRPFLSGAPPPKKVLDPPPGTC